MEDEQKQFFKDLAEFIYQNSAERDMAHAIERALDFACQHSEAVRQLPERLRKGMFDKLTKENFRLCLVTEPSETDLQGNAFERGMYGN